MKITKEEYEKNKKYKNFVSTFGICAFGLTVALIYPNKNNRRCRILSLILVLGVNSVGIIVFFWNVISNTMTMNIFDMSRNITIGGVILLFFFKSFYVNYKADLYHELLSKLDKDLLKGNYEDKQYQDVYDIYISKAKKGEKLWLVIPIVLSSLFPLYSTFSMIINNMQGDPNTRVMVHEMKWIVMEDRKYDAPYFHIWYVYNVFQCAILGPCFVGFDGSFCISTTLLSMKLKLLSTKLVKAFKETKSNEELEEQIKNGIRDHQEALNFYCLIQEIYGTWLFTVFLATTIMISFNLYQISLSGGVDPKYLIFALSAIIHTFSPCYYASKLQEQGALLTDELYCIGWETRNSVSITKTLMFMIAQTQQSLLLTGNGFVIYNMELFVSLLQTSYSFFTLMRS